MKTMFMGFLLSATLVAMPAAAMADEDSDAPQVDVYQGTTASGRGYAVTVPGENHPAYEGHDEKGSTFDFDAPTPSNAEVNIHDNDGSTDDGGGADEE